MVEPPRDALIRLAEARGTSLSALSRMLGRNVAYLQQYVGRGSPRVLPERERRMVADFFGVGEATLGGESAGAEAVLVPYLAVAASAGPGANVAEERVVRGEAIAPAALRRLGVAAADASIIRVAGDSMEPGIRDGDRVLVDLGARRLPTSPAVFVLRYDDLLAVKRVRREGAALAIVSDNPVYPPLRRAIDEVAIVGRARLLLRDL